MSVKPILQALVLAEHVWTLDDGRKAICGTFTKVTWRGKRVTQPTEGESRVLTGGTGSPWAYLCLTGVANNTVLQLQFVSLKRNAPLFRNEITLVGDDRLATVELALHLPHLEVPEPGIYAFDVVCDGEILGSWRVAVDMVLEGGEESDGNDDSADDADES